jgi:hypothetical protein
MDKIKEYVIICRQVYMDRAQLNEPFKYLLDSLKFPDHSPLSLPGRRPAGKDTP